MTGDNTQNCTCHDEQREWHKDPRYRAGGYWECSVRRREGGRRRYQTLSGAGYNKLLLSHRRHKALARRKARAA